MSLFLALIIILLAWFLLIAPFLRLIRISRQWQNTFKDARQQQQRRRQYAQPQPAKKKKKIDPSVGEYVEFTETSVTETETVTDFEGDSHTHTTNVSEQQITDVTWEDLPEK